MDTSFYAPYHGKSQCDGSTGLMRQAMNDHVNFENHRFETVGHLADFVNAKVLNQNAFVIDDRYVRNHKFQQVWLDKGADEVTDDGLVPVMSFFNVSFSWHNRKEPTEGDPACWEVEEAAHGDIVRIHRRRLTGDRAGKDYTATAEFHLVAKTAYYSKLSMFDIRYGGNAGQLHKPRVEGTRAVTEQNLRARRRAESGAPDGGMDEELDAGARPAAGEDEDWQPPAVYLEHDVVAVVRNTAGQVIAEVKPVRRTRRTRALNKWYAAYNMENSYEAD